MNFFFIERRKTTLSVLLSFCFYSFLFFFGRGGVNRNLKNIILLLKISVTI